MEQSKIIDTLEMYQLAPHIHAAVEGTQFSLPALMWHASRESAAYVACLADMPPRRIQMTTDCQPSCIQPACMPRNLLRPLVRLQAPLIKHNTTWLWASARYLNDAIHRAKIAPHVRSHLLLGLISLLSMASDEHKVDFAGIKVD